MLLAWIEKHETTLKYLIPLLSFAFVLRIPSLFEPFWYGDEGIYFAVAELINRGASLYTEAFDNKPPLIYLLTAFGIQIFGHTVWSARLLLMIWVLLTTVIIYLLSKKLFNGEKVALVSSLSFVLLSGTPLFEGFIANGELFMILPVALGFYLGLKNKFFLAGIAFSLAVLFKFPAVFDFIAFIVFLLLDQRKSLLSIKTLKSFLPLAFGFSIPIVSTVLYFLINGHFGDFFFATLGSNIVYTNIGNKFFIPNGLLLIKLIPLVFLTFFLFNKKSEEKRPGFYLILIWFAFTIYGALFGGRNYPHYLIQTLPPLSILISLAIFHKSIRNWSLMAIGIFLVIVTIFGFRPSYFKLSYYQNFFAYITGGKSHSEYSRWFDRKTPRNYELAKFVETRTSEKDYLFIWANEPQIYFLSKRLPPNRYTAAYHIDWFNGFDDAYQKILSKSPKFILVEKPQPYSFPQLDILLASAYNQVGQIEDVEIYQLKFTSLRKI